MTDLTRMLEMAGIKTKATGPIIHRLQNVYVRLRDPLHPENEPTETIKQDVTIQAGYADASLATITISSSKREQGFSLKYSIDSELVPGTCGRYVGSWHQDQETGAVFARVQGRQSPRHLVISPLEEK